MSLLSGKHIVKEVQEIRCTIVETGATRERVDFLKDLLELNGYEVKVEEEVKKAPPPPKKAKNPLLWKKHPPPIRLALRISSSTRLSLFIKGCFAPKTAGMSPPITGIRRPMKPSPITGI